MKAITFIIGFFALQLLYAQEEEKVFFPQEPSTEVGLNVTTVISSFVGSNDGTIDPGDYPLIVKFAKNNRAWRLGLGVNFKSREDNNSIGFGTNTTSNSTVFTKIGREWRQVVGKRFAAYYGFDILFNYLSESNEVFTPTDLVSLKLNNIGVGIGPIYGLQLALNERILFSFEGSFYGILTRSRVKEEFQQNPIFNKDETNWEKDVEMNMPQWLYLVVRF